MQGSDVKPLQAALEFCLAGDTLQAVCGWCSTAVILSDTGYSPGQTLSATAGTKELPPRVRAWVCGHLEPEVTVTILTARRPSPEHPPSLADTQGCFQRPHLSLTQRPALNLVSGRAPSAVLYHSRLRHWHRPCPHEAPGKLGVAKEGEKREKASKLTIPKLT